ncbi:hypothetical protein J1614_003603 [Plenodomus biglobosus]|nr:hypothetical protein J1614_003603 [Plenodomus biglobosus]
MLTITTQTSLPAPNRRLERSKRWLQRQLCKTTSRQTLNKSEHKVDCQAPLPIQRPRTAPSIQAELNASTPPLVPAFPISIERASPFLSVQPLPSAPRPDSGVVRDIDAWLEASKIMSSPPLMGGLSYWRMATGPGLKDTSQVQHAIPIVTFSGRSRPWRGQTQLRPFHRCARRVHVQMPSMLRTKSQPLAARKQNRRSVSMPVLAFPYETMAQAAPPRLERRPSSKRHLASRPSTAHATPAFYHNSTENEYARVETPVSIQGDPEDALDRRFHSWFPWTYRSADSTRPSTAAADHSREDSMGDLSDAPTYFSGPPPPSYRSRAASALTTSSFGCIDGMDLAQRQKSQERAALRRGMRGKLKRLAHNLAAQ